MKEIHKYMFKFKRFFTVREIEIRAFSLKSAIEKFYYIFPKCRILTIDEVAE